MPEGYEHIDALFDAQMASKDFGIEENGLVVIKKNSGYKALHVNYALVKKRKYFIEIETSSKYSNFGVSKKLNNLEKNNFNH